MDENRLGGHHSRRIQIAPIKRNGWTKARRKRFLDTLAATCNVTLAVEAVGMEKCGAYALRKRDPAFAALWQEALTLGYETLETALLEQALGGINAIEIVPAAIDAITGAPVVGQAPDAAVEGHDGPASAGQFRRIELNRLQFALALLNRHRAAVTGAAGRPAAHRPTTAAETDALLRAKLDRIAARMAKQGAPDSARHGADAPDEQAGDDA